MAKESQEQRDQAWWDRALVRGNPMGRWWRGTMRRIPSSPRCAFCLAPFAGVGGRALRFTKFKPSRKNPRWCRMCFEEAPLGGVELEIAVLFADVRGYTSMGERMPPDELAALMNRFYAAATDVLSKQDAVIDKLAGDQVMALFVPGLATRGHVAECATAAELLLQAVGYGGGDDEAWLPLGVGLDFGRAFVGNVGSGEVKDFTALGDVVNTAARLQAQAQAGQIVLSERMYAQVADRFPSARSVTLELKGKEKPVAARVVDLQPAAA